jgi:hypothetical protein
MLICLWVAILALVVLYAVRHAAGEIGAIL